MAEKKVKTEERKRKINVVRGTDYGIIYSDSVRFAVNPYDIKLTFSITEILPNNNAQINEIVTIAMSPQHAKIFAEKLTERVAEYMDKIMPLEINEEYAKKLQEAETKTIVE